MNALKLQHIEAVKKLAVMKFTEHTDVILCADLTNGWCVLHYNTLYTDDDTPECVHHWSNGLSPSEALRSFTERVTEYVEHVRREVVR